MENKSNVKRYFDIAEYRDSDGNLVFLLCNNHVDVEKFIKSCLLEFGVSPKDVRHVYFNDVKEKSDSYVKYKNVFKQSDSSGTPMTIGYV